MVGNTGYGNFVWEDDYLKVINSHFIISNKQGHYVKQYIFIYAHNDKEGLYLLDRLFEYFGGRIQPIKRGIYPKYEKQDLDIVITIMNRIYAIYKYKLEEEKMDKIEKMFT